MDSNEHILLYRYQIILIIIGLLAYWEKTILLRNNTLEFGKS